MIASLQSSNGGREGRGGGQVSAHESALEEIRTEKQLLLSQLHMQQEQTTVLEEKLQNAEDQHVIEAEQMSQQLKLSEEALDDERRRSSGLQEDLNRLTEVYE